MSVKGLAHAAKVLRVMDHRLSDEAGMIWFQMSEFDIEAARIVSTNMDAARKHLAEAAKEIERVVKHEQRG